MDFEFLNWKLFFCFLDFRGRKKFTMSTNSGTSADIHFSALCNSIEHEKLEKARAILETHPSLHLDIANNDGFTPLDLAFMTGNHDMLKLLLSHRCDDETG